METTIKTNRTRISVRTEKSKSISNSSFWETMEFNRFGIIPILLVILGCFGGLAASYGAQADLIKLILITLSSTIALAFMLAVAPMRTIFYASLIALCLDFFILIF